MRSKDYVDLRNTAENLRKKGLSFKEIRLKVPVSKSTLSKWCKDIKLNQAQIKRLGSLYDRQLRGAKANQKRSLERKQRTRETALGEIPNVTPDILKVAGAMLYWAEGSKTRGTYIVNSDPLLISFYIKWLREILSIRPVQLTAHLHLHSGQIEEKEKLFWSGITGIPEQNFHKTYFKPEGKGYRKNNLFHGTIRIRVKGKGVELLRYRIMGWVEAIAKQTLSNRIVTVVGR